jgi:hypothetical protein
MNDTKNSLELLRLYMTGVVSTKDQVDEKCYAYCMSGSKARAVDVVLNKMNYLH